MIVEDVIVNKILTNDEIKAGIASSIKIDINQVEVVDEIPYDSLPSDCWIMCHKILRTGDFPLQLSIYIRVQKLENIDLIKSMKEFSTKTGSSVLISDQDDNPYSRLLINSSGECKKVYLEPEHLDENEEFVIQSDCPIS